MLSAGHAGYLGANVDKQSVKRLVRRVYPEFRAKETSKGKLTHTNHWLRRVMDAETNAIVMGWDTGTLDAIEISGSAWKNAGFKSFRRVNYAEFDVCTPYDDWPDALKTELVESADVVLAEQVWEHLAYPYRATLNVLRMLRPGGRFLVTTPFLVKVHGPPEHSDCSRWTAEGMQFFLEECGFDPATISVESWGNKECAAAHLTSEVWLDYAEGMNLENDPTYPCMVWAVGQKPA